jgi:hypothetical protein
LDEIDVQDDLVDTGESGDDDSNTERVASVTYSDEPDFDPNDCGPSKCVRRSAITSKCKRGIASVVDVVPETDLEEFASQSELVPTNRGPLKRARMSTGSSKRKKTSVVDIEPGTGLEKLTMQSESVPKNRGHISLLY